MVFDCSRGRCPKYFSDVYISVHTVTARSRLSAVHGDLVVPRVLSRFGCHSFCVSGPQFGTIFLSTFEALTSRVNSLSVALRSGYLSARTAEGASEKQSSLKAHLRNGLTYLHYSALRFRWLSRLNYLQRIYSSVGVELAVASRAHRL